MVSLPAGLLNIHWSQSAKPDEEKKMSIRQMVVPVVFLLLSKVASSDVMFLECSPSP
jgi:hypothetical protein